MNKHAFHWAVGIEDTFVTQTERGERPLDEYELTQHYDNWEADLELAKGTGATMIRYGIPWYKIEKEEGRFDWSWVDQVMDYFRSNRDLVPIIDLMHYGTPHWLDGEFFHKGYPAYVARYAKAFAERYQDLVTYYTPLNEPFVTAEFCGLNGTWPPYGKGLKGFYQMAIQVGKGIVKTVEAIKEVDETAVMVHVDATKKYITKEPQFTDEAALWDENGRIFWELLNGRIREGHLLYPLMLQYGVSKEQLVWFEKNGIDFDVIGINYYPQFSVHEIRRDENGRIHDPHIMGSGEDLKDIIRECYQRYQKPVFITETSFNGTEIERIDWLRESVRACKELREEGVELLGYTWFPFFDLVDWGYRTSGKSAEEELMPFGLYTLKMSENGHFQRMENEVGKTFKSIVKNEKFSNFTQDNS